MKYIKLNTIYINYDFKNIYYQIKIDFLTYNLVKK